MKSVIETLLERRSIRRYERETLTPEQVRLIHDAIRNTPTSYNGQQYSVIEIDDQELKEKLYDITGQKQIKTCNRFYLFCAYYNKISLGAEAKKIEMPAFTTRVESLIVGVIDASLAMMSALVAAESCGLGTCPIGYARTAAPEKFAELLNLPPKVYVVCGLAVGVPREMPDMKPKQNEKLLIFKNGYRTDDMTADILEFDRDIVRYNETRSGTKTDNDWISHIVDYYSEEMPMTMLDSLRRRGFDLRQ